MKKVDMSAHAVTARLKRVAQLRRLGLSLQKAKLHTEENRAEGNRTAEPGRSPTVREGSALPNTPSGTPKAK
jgi:hypothetical protein